MAVEAVLMAETVDLDPTRDAAFDCDVIRTNSGVLGGDDNIMQPKSAMGREEKDALLLRDSVRGWSNCVELSEVGVLLWNVDGEAITFAAEFLSEGGAAALGISANTGMCGADLWWVGRDDDGNATLKEMFLKGVFRRRRTRHIGQVAGRDAGARMPRDVWRSRCPVRSSRATRRTIGTQRRASRK